MASPTSIHPRPITVAEVKDIAEKNLEEQVWRYYVDGAQEQITAQRNQSISNELYLRPHVLRDVTHVDTGTTILGKRYDIPIAIAPSAF
ncbi:hypothetical protein QQX98_004090 [Neonectria punicea]|uniref:FMN hydroxy acid dehydrogenase domain-containing protein n=1 Tax=Neonectria punicea TaxID=979145 RepID=A0ABR1HAY4_9HYPO